MKILLGGLIYKFYCEFFYVPKYGKIREKVMLTRAVSTVAVIAICLAAMGFSAYAYFTCNVTSNVGVLQAASFTAQVAVSDGSGQPVTPEATDGRTQTFRLLPGLYTVQLDKGSGDSSTGFCVVNVGGMAYHTQQLGADIAAENGVRNQVVFQLNVLQETVVTIESSWGTSASYATANTQYIISSQPLQVIVADGAVNVTPAETVYTVAAGDSLSVIAQTLGIPLERLIAYNEITDPDWIDVGQQIKIPPAD